MQKIIRYIWLPLASLLALALICGGLTIYDVKNQNQKQNQKQKEFEKQISLLENKFEELVASTKQKNQQPTSTKKIAGISTKATSTSILTPTPSTTLGASPTPTPTHIPTTAPSPTPSTTLGASPTPTPTPVSQASVTIGNVGTYKVDLENDDTAFSVLLRAGKENGFTVEYQTYEGMGAYVACIAGVCAHDNFYWAFYYNGSYSMVGAGAQPVSSGDTTTWKFESF